MNTKTAKRLRKEARYHPTDPRKYERVGNTGTIEVSAECSRSLYRELKKEYKANK